MRYMKRGRKCADRRRGGVIMEYQIILKEYEGSIPVREEVWKLDGRQKEQRKAFTSFPVQVGCLKKEEDGEEQFVIRGETLGTVGKPISMTFCAVEEEWNGNEYVFMPGAVYNGNRFESLRLPYPPYHAGRKGKEWNQVITDIPHLDRDGNPSKIQFLSGDMSTPAIGICSRERKEGMVMLGQHKINGCYTGFSVRTSKDRGSFEISVPGIREKTKYFFGELPDGSGFYPTCDALSDDEGIIPPFGERIEMKIRLYHFPVENMQDFFVRFNDVREELETGKPFATIPFSKAYEEIKQKYLLRCFDEEGYFTVGSDNDTPPSMWQAGWVGGGMNTLAFLLEDEKEAAEKALSTLKFIVTKLQRENGWYFPMYARGKAYGDDFEDTEKPILLVRKDADLLYFLLKQAIQLEGSGKMPEDLHPLLRTSMEKQADAFVRLFQKNAQIGQFIDMEKEALVQGDTASAAMAPAALALAYEYFGKVDYLNTAEALARLYREEYLRKGIVNGGPGEICQAPDSESAFALLESFVQLFETTGKKEWLNAAREAFELAVTWVASYDFEFPKGSTASELQAHSRGTVFANAQNKHSAPGICTLSGNSILKLYRATGEEHYLKWLSYISHALPQFVSLTDRRIKTLDGRLLQPGYINERVQTSDWEGKETVGGFLYGDNWPDVSMMLTYVEIPGIYVNAREKKLWCFDHMAAKWQDEEKKSLMIKNSTPHTAKVKILVDEPGENQPLGHRYFERMKEVEIGAGEEVAMEL